MAAKDTDAGTVTVEVKYYFKGSSGSWKPKVEKRATTEIIMYSKHKLSLSLSFSLSHSPTYLSLSVWVCALAFVCVCVCVCENKLFSRVLFAEETPEDIVPCVACRRDT